MGYYPGDETLEPFLVAPYGIESGEVRAMCCPRTEIK